MAERVGPTISKRKLIIGGLTSLGALYLSSRVARPTNITPTETPSPIKSPVKEAPAATKPTQASEKPSVVSTSPTITPTPGFSTVLTEADMETFVKLIALNNDIRNKVDQLPDIAKELIDMAIKHFARHAPLPDSNPQEIANFLSGKGRAYYASEYNQAIMKDMCSTNTLMIKNTIDSGGYSTFPPISEFYINLSDALYFKTPVNGSNLKPNAGATIFGATIHELHHTYAPTKPLNSLPNMTAKEIYDPKTGLTTIADTARSLTIYRRLADGCIIVGGLFTEEAAFHHSTTEMLDILGIHLAASEYDRLVQIYRQQVLTKMPDALAQRRLTTLALTTQPDIYFTEIGRALGESDSNAFAFTKGFNHTNQLFGPKKQ